MSTLLKEIELENQDLNFEVYSSQQFYLIETKIVIKL
jgi:hypothetical protein